MSGIVKSMLRPTYRAFVQLPFVRHILAREAGANVGEFTLWDFVQNDYGADYGVTRKVRAGLLEEFKRNCLEIPSATLAAAHAVLAREILSIPRSLSGDVIECGCFKGASTASLSRVSRLVGRRLIVCDSFQGLPEDGAQLHTWVHVRTFGHYKKGMFCGRVDEVKANVARYGDIDVCDFVPGFFSESLPSLSRQLVFGFLDVDLVSSARDCLRYIWPLLREGGTLYSDDAGDMDVVRVFFDEAWWHENLHQAAPGLVGSGCGIPGIFSGGSPMGYVRKLGKFDSSKWRRAESPVDPNSP